MGTVHPAELPQDATSMDVGQMPISPADTASPDTPEITGPSLPTEIIYLIIRSLLADLDRQSLARCMQASISLGVYIAPLLYRTITLNSRTKHLFDGRPKRTGTGVHAHSSFLRYMKEFIVIDHEGKDYPYTAERWKRLRLEVDVLRIIPPTVEPPAAGTLPNPTSLASAPVVQGDDVVFNRCLCTLGINPRKIIMERTSLHRPFPAPEIHPMAKIDNVVSKICTISDGTDDYLRHSVPCQQGGGQQFYIIMPNSIRQCTDEDAMTLLREMLMAVMPRNSASTIILVNIDALGIPPPIPDAVSVQYSSLAEYYIGEVSRMRESTMRDASANPDMWRGRYKSLEELKLISLKCITIDQYLADYDTTDVFTEAELAAFKDTQISSRAQDVPLPPSPQIDPQPVLASE